MFNDLKEKILNLISKIRKIKHFEIYLAIGLAVFVVLGYFIFSKPSSNANQEGTTSKNDIVCENISSSSEYASFLENKLENVITSIKGVGNVKVAVTLEKGFEYVYATEEETKTSSNGTTITTLSIVMINGQPVIKEEIFPVVKGIVVVASGAEDVGIRMNILSIIQTIIEVDNSQIKILSGF